MSIPLGALSSFYFIEIYDDIAPTISANTESGLSDVPDLMLYHPLFFALIFVAIVTCVVLPSYVAALTADKGFIGNALSVGIFVSLCNLLIFDLIIRNPIYFILIVAITILASCMAGVFRKSQVMNGKG